MHLGVQDLYFVIALFAAGVLGGYTGGLFGIGGGTVTVPILVTLFPFFGVQHSVVMHMAVGTSLALLTPNTYASVRKQWKMGNFDKPLFKSWMPFIIVGALIGVSVVKFLPTLYLKIIFAIYLYLSFLLVALKRGPESEVEGKPHGISKVIAGFVIGAVSVFLGTGGGTFTTPYCRMHNYPMKKAIALSSATGLVIGVIGTIGVIIGGWGVPGRAPYSFGFVNILAFVLMAPILMFMAPHGVRMANKLSKRKLQWVYAVFLLVVAAYMTFLVFHSSATSPKHPTHLCSVFKEKPSWYWAAKETQIKRERPRNH